MEIVPLNRVLYVGKSVNDILYHAIHLIQVSVVLWRVGVKGAAFCTKCSFYRRVKERENWAVKQDARDRQTDSQTEKQTD